MRKLLVQRLHDRAILPSVAHQGEDLGYDVYACEDVFIAIGAPTLVRTGTAVVYVEIPWYRIWARFLLGLDPLGPGKRKYGLQIVDRSGLASKFGLHVLAGTIDAGYRGELCVVMMLLGPPVGPPVDARPEQAGPAPYPWEGYQVRAGDKIAQMLPRLVLTSGVKCVRHLPAGQRGVKGFGSTGR